LSAVSSRNGQDEFPEKARILRVAPASIRSKEISEIPDALRYSMWKNFWIGRKRGGDMKGNNDVNRDYAGDDPRSVKAWLRGEDDGRGRAYERFHRELLRRDPTTPEDEMEGRYHAALQAGWCQPKTRYRKHKLIGFVLYAALVCYYVHAYL
jgi:hypothetical protein